jgi:hypothetical protein
MYIKTAEQENTVTVSLLVAALAADSASRPTSLAVMSVIFILTVTNICYGFTRLPLQASTGHNISSHCIKNLKPYIVINGVKVKKTKVTI